MAQQVLFLRHSETQLNAEKRISGRSMDLPVLEIRDIPCDIPVDTVLSSPALRCRQTLEGFLKEQPVADIRYLPEMAERSMGFLEGHLRSDMAARYPDLFSGQKFRLFETPPGGESFADFQTRVRTFWETHRNATDGTLLICSHNQFLKMLYLTIHDLPITEARWKELSFPTGIVEKVL